jgi:S1-C subfamily serine protease
MKKHLPLILAAGMLLSVACSVPLRVATTHKTSPSPVQSQTTAAAGDSSGASAALSAFQATLEAVATAAQASIVQIDTSQGLGSGIVYDSKGDIVTNNHVVEGASSYSVKTSDGKTYQATLVGTYAANDLAVIKVSGASLPPAKFADSTAIKIGEVVLAVGSPFGLTGTVTEGIVSAIGRTQSEGGNGVTLNDLVQTSAHINPGNSGGALVDINGAVIGIPTLAGADSQGRQSSSGIGFAIPSNQVTNAARQLVASGTVTHTNRPYLGVNTHDDQVAGADVVAVVAGGPAAKAGVKVGWVITGIGGHDVADTDGLSQVLATYQPGNLVAVEVRLPDGSSRSLSVTLGERPANP